MEEILNKMVEGIKTAIINDLKAYPFKNNDVMNMVIAAYNRFQEDERDGVDYLFNINDKDDLKCCVEGGMNACEIAWLYGQSNINTTTLFYFGVNYESPQPIATWGEVKECMIGWLEEVLPCVIAYPTIAEYEPIYTRYVTDYMIRKELVP